MRIAHITILLLLPALGCTQWQQAKRTMFSELNEFPRVTEGRLACIQYNRWAKRELKELVATGGDFSSDYASGFLKGFSNYVYGGGSIEPPPLAPRRYWRMGFRNEYGDQAIQQWYEGYAMGARTAKEKGYRKRATVPTSMLLGYNLEDENTWLSEENAPGNSSLAEAGEEIIHSPTAQSDEQIQTEEMPDLAPNDDELEANGDSRFPTDVDNGTGSETVPETTPDASGVTDPNDDPIIIPNDDALSNPDATLDEQAFEEPAFDESGDDIESLDIPELNDDPSGDMLEDLESGGDALDLELGTELDQTSTKKKTSPFAYVYQRTPPALPWTSMAKSTVQPTPKSPKVQGPAELTAMSLQAQDMVPGPINSSGFVPLEDSVLKLDAIVPANAEILDGSQPEKSETVTNDKSGAELSTEKATTVTEVEDAAWQSRD